MWPPFLRRRLELRGRLDGWPRDVVQVADALGLNSFAVAGSSGAGPYVGACAYALRIAYAWLE
jgi:hypothetical protein